MKKHIIWMIIGCTIPLLLIFFAPALGLSENVSFFIGISTAIIKIIPGMLKLKAMNHINIRKFGMAFGLTGALLYLGCMLLMITVGKSGTVKFFNTLLHGLDVSSVIRMDVPLWEAGIGIVQTFMLCWLIGACVAVFYNATIKDR